jgi:hypothetical protein
MYRDFHRTLSSHIYMCVLVSISVPMCTYVHIALAHKINQESVVSAADVPTIVIALMIILLI